MRSVMAHLDAHRMSDRAAAELQYGILAETVKQLVHLPSMTTARCRPHHPLQIGPGMIEEDAPRPIDWHVRVTIDIVNAAC
jgi:hypothetical protein